MEVREEEVEIEEKKIEKKGGGVEVKGRKLTGLEVEEILDEWSLGGFELSDESFWNFLENYEDYCDESVGEDLRRRLRVLKKVNLLKECIKRRIDNNVLVFSEKFVERLDKLNSGEDGKMILDLAFNGRLEVMNEVLEIHIKSCRYVCRNNDVFKGLVYSVDLKSKNKSSTSSSVSRKDLDENRLNYVMRVLKGEEFLSILDGGCYSSLEKIRFYNKSDYKYGKEFEEVKVKHSFGELEYSVSPETFARLIDLENNKEYEEYCDGIAGELNFEDNVDERVDFFSEAIPRKFVDKEVKRRKNSILSVD